MYPDKDFNQQVSDITALRSNDPNAFVRFNQVKIYVDGIISQATAALVDPYEAAVGLPPAEQNGFLYFDVPTLNNYSAAFESAGFQLHYHVTGDRGTRLALDAIAEAFSRNGLADQRHRLTHCYLVHPDDRSRFSTLGVFADFQVPPSALSPANLADVQFLLGTSRAAGYLPAGSLLSAGADLTLSSDFDADEISPFVKIETVLTRTSENIPGVDTAVKLMTINPARLLHHEDKTGTIEVGKLADLIIINQNIFTIPTAQISDTLVYLTMLGGTEIYRHASF